MELTRWDSNTPVADMTVAEIGARFAETKDKVQSQIVMGIYLSPTTHIDVSVVGAGNMEMGLMCEFDAYLKGIEYADIEHRGHPPALDVEQATDAHGWDVFSMDRDEDGVPIREHAATFSSPAAANAYRTAAETVAKETAEHGRNP